MDHFLGSIEGTVYISSYKMYFKSDPTPKNTEESVVLNVPLGVITHVEKIGRSRQKGDNVIYGLDVHCKDMRTLRFAFAHNQESHGRRGMYDRLQIVAFPCSYGKNVYAFHFRGDYPDDGWEVYDPEAELKRMGVGNDGVPWRICHLNKNYELCDTYTSTFSVPLNCSDEMVQGVAQFRSKGRIP
uniref:Myotubularin phosphatase domain-containing protein n=1 Tax=Amphimedon queenslandica TaxID=400682 RepID=A0A1X7SQ88_AMPQE